MKFSITSGELLKALSKANSVIQQKSPIEILDNFLFDVSGSSLTISATNLEISIRVILNVKGNTNGRIAVPSRRIYETVAALPLNTQINFTADLNSKKIVMNTEKGTYHLTGETAEEFPELPKIEKANEFEFSNESISKIINKTKFAVSDDIHRPAMTGVLFQFKKSEFVAVSTDGHRLVKFSLKKFKSNKEQEIIIPQKTLNILGKLVEEYNCILSVVEQKQIWFSFSNVILFSRVIDEKYPNYETVIPNDNDKKLVIERQEIQSSVKRVGLYSSSQQNSMPIKFSLKKNLLTVSAENPEMGCNADEEIECEYSGTNFETGFNSSYVIEMTSHISSKEIMFLFSTPTRAAIIKPNENESDEDVLMLIMPLRLNS